LWKPQLDQAKPIVILVGTPCIEQVAEFWSNPVKGSPNKANIHCIYFQQIFAVKVKNESDWIKF